VVSGVLRQLMIVPASRTPLELDAIHLDVERPAALVCAVSRHSKSSIIRYKHLSRRVAGRCRGNSSYGKGRRRAQHIRADVAERVGIADLKNCGYCRVVRILQNDCGAAEYATGEDDKPHSQADYSFHIFFPFNPFNS